MSVEHLCMGNLLSFESATTSACPNHHSHSSIARKTTTPVPDFNGKPLEWPIWKTKVKASFRTSNTIHIIETPGEQDKPELNEDRVCVHGVLQMSCAKGTVCHIINKHERNIDPFSTWEDLSEWCDRSANRDDNANQILFKLDTLKSTTRMLVDQCAQDFLELCARMQLLLLTLLLLIMFLLLLLLL